MGGQVVVVKDPDPEHGGVHTGTQEEDCDEARHLVEKCVRSSQQESCSGLELGSGSGRHQITWIYR